MAVPPAVQRTAALLLVLGCQYESWAVVVGRHPTISAICRRHRWLRVALEAAWVLHL